VKRKLTMRDVGKAAGPNVEVWDDKECGCYRATCAQRFCFEDGALHELVGVYVDAAWDVEPGARQAALADMIERFARPGHPGYEAEPCTVTDCDWCGTGAGTTPATGGA